MSLGRAQLHLGLLLPQVGLMQLAPQGSPIPHRYCQIERNEISQVRQDAGFRKCRCLAVQGKAICFDAPVGIDQQGRQESSLGAGNVQIRLAHGLHRRLHVRIHPPGHLLHFADGGQWLGLDPDRPRP